MGLPKDRTRRFNMINDDYISWNGTTRFQIKMAPVGAEGRLTCRDPWIARLIKTYPRDDYRGDQ